MAMTQIIGLKDLRENTEQYISRVKKGKSFLVVRRSKPIFRVSPVDEFGDEGLWDTVVDFTKINKNGMPISDVIASLKRLHAQDR
ncbi:MAG: type II toxin-antitoxin system prevent-host-death family antitoxin [bacterium]